MHVRKVQRIFHGLHHLDFLGDGIHKRKLGLRKEYRQRNARKPAPRAYIHHPAPRQEPHAPPDGQTVQHMVGVEIVHILARNHIDFGVPLSVERPQSLETG